MNIRKISSKEEFLRDVVNYLEDHFSSKFGRVKVIMPSGFMCTSLQNYLIDNGNYILPTITTINELTTEGGDVFEMPSRVIDTLTYLEEKTLLSKIIWSYEKFAYNLQTSIRLSMELANIFFELEANNIDISELEKLPDFGQAKHWDNIFAFLIYANSKWLSYIKSVNKSTRAQKIRTIYNSEINRVKNSSDHHIVIAGEVGSNEITRFFISEIAKLSNGHLLLPNFLEIKENESPLSPGYNIAKLVKMLDGFNFPASSASKERFNDFVIEYKEFDAIAQEVAYITQKCQELSSKDPSAKIAIICNNYKNKNLFEYNFCARHMHVRDLIGMSLLENLAVDFLVNVARLITENFTLKNLMKVLLHPEMICDNAIALQNIMIRKDRFVRDINIIKEILETEDIEIASWFSDIADIINSIDFFRSSDTNSSQFRSILGQTIKVVEKLSPDIWSKHNDYKIADSIRELSSISWKVQLPQIRDFSRIFIELLHGARISKTGISRSNDLSNIILCKSGEVYLYNFDYIFIPDFNDGVFPEKSIENPWFNKKLQEKLDLPISSRNIGKQIYEFYAILHNKNIFITRSKTNLNGTDLIESDLFSRFTEFDGIILKKNKVQMKRSHSFIKSNSEFVYAEKFPSRISATDIETLIKSPYNFYAKKILGLKKLNELDEKENLADFGNFVHNIFDLYGKNYKDNEKESLLIFNNICNIEIKKLIVPDQIKDFWYNKIIAIGPEFVQFELERRKSCSSVITECKGSLDMIICDRIITISTIADRIEINKNGSSIIFDYKTGSIPTMQEVRMGLSPQLIIEAIIAESGGFDGIKHVINKVCYVKIAHRSPYIKIIEIDLKQYELATHIEGLKTLLTHYVKHGRYAIEQNLMSYDDYRHMARRDVVYI